MGPRSDERGNAQSPCARPVNGNPSMGPRSDERGNTFLSTSTSKEFLKPSMGPRSDERGNGHPAHELLAKHTPSMGPRSDERGNGEETTPVEPPINLQWGRARMSAEIWLGGAP